MKKVIGYIVKDRDGEVIAATGDVHEAMHIAHEWIGLVIMVETTPHKFSAPTVKHTPIYDGDGNVYLDGTF